MGIRVGYRALCILVEPLSASFFCILSDILLNEIKAPFCCKLFIFFDDFIYFFTINLHFLGWNNILTRNESVTVFIEV